MLFLVLIHATVTVYNENSELSTVVIISKEGEQSRAESQVALYDSGSTNKS